MIDPRVVRLVATAGAEGAVSLAGAARSVDRRAKDGRYLRLGAAVGAPTACLLTPQAAPSTPLAALVVLDAHTPQRIEALLRLWRVLAGLPVLGPPRDLTPGRRARLVMMLRALDGRRAGATRRAIAQALFGAGAVPPGEAFDDHHLRSRTARLLRDGAAMVRGGYRQLVSG